MEKKLTEKDWNCLINSVEEDSSGRGNRSSKGMDLTAEEKCWIRFGGTIMFQTLVVVQAMHGIETAVVTLFANHFQIFGKLPDVHKMMKLINNIVNVHYHTFVQRLHKFILKCEEDYGNNEEELRAKLLNRQLNMFVVGQELKDDSLQLPEIKKEYKKEYDGISNPAKKFLFLLENMKGKINFPSKLKQYGLEPNNLKNKMQQLAVITKTLVAQKINGMIMNVGSIHVPNSTFQQLFRMPQHIIDSLRQNKGKTFFSIVV